MPQDQDQNSALRPLEKVGSSDLLAAAQTLAFASMGLMARWGPYGHFLSVRNRTLVTVGDGPLHMCGCEQSTPPAHDAPQPHEYHPSRCTIPAAPSPARAVASGHRTSQRPHTQPSIAHTYTRLFLRLTSPTSSPDPSPPSSSSSLYRELRPPPPPCDLSRSAVP